MKYKSSKELTKPKRCWVLRDADNAAGCIYSPFRNATWELGIEKQIHIRKTAKIKDMVEDDLVTKEVFHAFCTKKQALQANEFMHYYSLFEAEGNGIEVKGTLYSFDEKMDGQPCVGYTALKLTKLSRKANRRYL